ncbi:hypothetical protein BKA59DRAFT_39470 [Fusarium tricinctum]|uniref:Uncharacterized protein n=1 Tax=Fusarium tricinctum TaxID=61284 RepID=A0A8K0SAK1_9HYPO|nr:hypothetical protein BKA59DRAFT_39470 [Fusarium tricinctum]
MSRLITLALYDRDNFSRGNARRTFGYEAYHWGIIIMPEGSQERDCIAFEATDASTIDPVTFRMNNPTMDWFMRRKDESDPEFGTKLLGCIIIGQVPDAISNAQLEALFGTVPLPVKNTHPQQSCVTWAIDAIRVLQKQGWASQFELNGFKDWALYYADERIKTGLSREPEIAYYRV